MIFFFQILQGKNVVVFDMLRVKMGGIEDVKVGI